MKKRIIPLLLALALLLSAVPAMAAGFTVSYSLNGSVYKTQEVSDGSVTLPAPPSATGVFVGWSAEIDGSQKLYPAGAAVKVTADTTFEALFIDYTTCEGASVRIFDGDVALRFTSKIAKSDFDRLVELVGLGSLRFGTYITAKDYLKRTSYSFTIEALKNAGFNKYLDIPAGGFYNEDKDYYYFAGSVGHILDENYSRDYSGIGYMGITYSNGAEATVYSTFHYVDNSRNIYQVVLSAYEDRDSSYQYIVPLGAHGNEYSATHSPYTLEQLDAMKKYLDAVASISIVANGDVNAYIATKGTYYSTPWRVVYEMDEYERATITVTAAEPFTLADLKTLFFGGSRLALDAGQVTITETTVVIAHSSYSKPY